MPLDLLTPALLTAPGAALVTLTKPEDLYLALLRCSIAGPAEAGPGVRADQMAVLSSSNAVANRNTRLASTASS